MTLDVLATHIRSVPWQDALSEKMVRQSDTTVNDSSKSRLKGVAKDLEALLFYEMLKEMRQTSQGGLLGKGMGSDIYTSLFDMEMAKMFAERGLGLGDMVLKQFSLREGKSPESPSAPLKDLPQSTLKKEADPVSATGLQRGDQGPRSIDPRKETSFHYPVQGRVSSNFGWRSDPISGEEKFHGGMDIAASSGQEIYPINNGRVIFSGLTQGYGNTVVIDHGDGYLSKYGHNLTNLVSVGDQVKPDQAIALVGSTGRSTGPHLHLEVQFQGKKINPQDLFPETQSNRA